MFPYHSAALIFSPPRFLGILIFCENSEMAAIKTKPIEVSDGNRDFFQAEPRGKVIDRISSGMAGFQKRDANFTSGSGSGFEIKKKGFGPGFGFCRKQKHAKHHVKHSSPPQSFLYLIDPIF
jgi:hypothetical protein